jgi:tRNA A-37 threonylcarbamoyl transferase component Bud32
VEQLLINFFCGEGATKQIISFSAALIKEECGMIRLKKITIEELAEKAGDAEVLLTDGYGAKVLLTSDRKIIKFFRLKNRFSSALFNPYALRFLRNSRVLKNRGVASVSVEAVFDVPGIKRQIIIYPMLSGTVLREALSENCSDELRAELLERLAAFIATLHNKGILFRSAHLGNILVSAAGDFALIDVADIRFNRFCGLLPWQRIRNFRHMFRYPEDRKFLAEFYQRFLNVYLKKSRFRILKRISAIYISRYFRKGVSC